MPCVFLYEIVDMPNILSYFVVDRPCPEYGLPVAVYKKLRPMICNNWSSNIFLGRPDPQYGLPVAVI